MLAFRGSDGVVMCADTQASGSTKEYALKITPIGKNALLGCCSGFDDYISHFTRFVEYALANRGDLDYYKVVLGAILEYSKDIHETGETVGLKEEEVKKLCYSSGVLAIYDRIIDGTMSFRQIPHTHPWQ